MRLMLILLLFSLFHRGISVPGSDNNEVYNFLKNSYFGDYFTFRSDKKNIYAERERLIAKYDSFAYNRYWIDKRRHESMTPEEYQEIYENTWPVLISGLINTLPMATSELLTPAKLLENYANASAAVTLSSDGRMRSRESQKMTISAFHKLINSFAKDSSAWAYLTDEIFMTEHSTLRELIPHIFPFTKPNFFKEIFSHPFQSPEADLLWGSAGSRSSMHVDPCNWTGISWLLSGRKRWKLIAPADIPIKLTTVVPFAKVFPLPCDHYTSHEDAFSPETAPNWQGVGIDIVQEPGDMLVIPSGWMHQAYNYEETIAVSTSVMNAQNYREVLLELAKVGVFSRIPSELLENGASLSPEEIIAALLKVLKPNILTDSIDSWKHLRPN